MGKKQKDKTCLDCPCHKVIPDPDPYDRFCDDDVAVVCSEMPNDNLDYDSRYLSDRSEFKVVSCSCRPYKVKKESKIPEWCPNIKKG